MVPPPVGAALGPSPQHLRPSTCAPARGPGPTGRCATMAPTAPERGADVPEHLPEVYTQFRSRFPEVARAQDQVARTVDAAGPLDERTTRLVKLGIAVGAQAEGAVRSNVRKALAAGASVADVEQVVLLGLTTRGFPATIAAWQWMAEVVDERAEPAGGAQAAGEEPL